MRTICSSFYQLIRRRTKNNSEFVMSIKVVDFDIGHQESIEGLGGFDAVEIFFKEGRELLGRARIPCSGDSLAPEELRPFIEKLPEPSPLDVPNQSLPTVTVAVCTINRSGELEAVLHSIADQDYPPDEILVVDNACKEEIRILVEQTLPDARYLTERRPGLDFARNRALFSATKDIIAFIDDDAVADAFWVRSLAECFAAFPKAGAVTGVVLPIELETPAQELFEVYGGFERGFIRRILPHDRKRRFGMRQPIVAEAISVGTGCNMAIRTAVLKELQGFDEALDTGSPLPGGGDLDIFYRVLRAGYELVYEPRAFVQHNHRRTEKELYKQLRGHQRGFIAFLVKTVINERGQARAVAALFLAWHQIKKGYRLLRKLVGFGRLPVKLLAHVLVAGFAGIGSYHASRRRIQAPTVRNGGNLPKLAGQLPELWRYRELVWNLTVRDLKVKYQRSWLGFMWTLLNPLCTVGVLVAVFSYVVRIPIDNYWAFLISGYFAWNFFSQTLNGGVQAAVGNAYLTRSVYFPQEVLVVSAALARLLEFLGELMIVMVILAIFHHQGVPLSFIMVIPLISILFLLVIGISLPFVTMGVYYYDTVQAIPLATLALFYASPVFYNIGLVPESIRSVYLLNPMASMLDMYHTALYQGVFPDLTVFFVMSGVACGLVLLSYMFFNRKKREFAEIV
jgi:ABC-type polysaccharide/polyol phosphate export permease/GT2 family glycosyltransferase